MSESALKKVVTTFRVGKKKAQNLLDPWKNFPCVRTIESFSFQEVPVDLDHIAISASNDAFPHFRLITRAPLYGRSRDKNDTYLQEPFWFDTGVEGTRVTINTKPRIVAPETIDRERKTAPTVHQLGQAIALYFWKTGQFLVGEKQYVVTSSYSEKWKRWALVSFRPDCGMFVTLNYDPPPNKIIALH